MATIQSNPCWRLDASVRPICGKQHRLQLTSLAPTARRPEHQMRFSGTFTAEELRRLRDALDRALDQGPRTERGCRRLGPGRVRRMLVVYEEKVSTPFARETSEPESLEHLRFLPRKRLLDDTPPPTMDEADGIKILALDYLHDNRLGPEQPYGR